ncbi:MAG: RNA polymerase sigma factor RpoD/SigA [Spirochaetales bacterium]|nr:RNA polymerase sigma factor RpoD/SigA [Spirochaetales bacterium]
MKSKEEQLDDENVIAMYLKEINSIPLLNREDEDRYATLAAQGDDNARQVIIQANLRFVVNVAKRYQNQGLPLMDLISEGNIGLINAIKKYDVTRGYHFISYAVWWIRQAILKAICEKSRMIKLPLNKANELVQIEKVKKELTKKNGQEPDVDDIARFLNMPVEQVTKLINISREIVSLETPVYVEKDSLLLKEYVQGDSYRTPDELMMEKSLKVDIKNILETLSPKEAEVIMDRFGLDDRKPLSLKEIGQKFDLSKERIRQIEKKALKRLKHPSRAELLANYLEDE